MKSVFDRIKSFFRGRGRPLGAALSLIPAALAALMSLYYIWGPGQGYFHSDCSDSLYWANATVEAGEVFDDTFRYAGMLPFSVSAIFVPLIRLFGVGMTAQNIGMSLFALIFIASVIFLCRSLKAGWGWSSVAAFVTTAALAGSDKLREIMFGHNIYYTIGPVIMFFGLGLLLRTERSLLGGGFREPRRAVAASATAVLFALLCAGAATDGGQVIVIGSLPALAGMLAVRFFDGKKSLAHSDNLIMPVSAAAFLLGSLLGSVLLNRWKGGIECGYADAYSGWSDVGTWADNARAFVKQYFTLIGVSPSGNLFSSESVGPMIRIAGGVLLLAVPVALFCFYRRISDGTRAVLWSHSVVTAAVMFGFICGKLSGANWRLTPILASSALLCVLAARELFAAVRGADRAADGAPDGTAALTAAGSAAEAASEASAGPATDSAAEAAPEAAVDGSPAGDAVPAASADRSPAGDAVPASSADRSPAGDAAPVSEKVRGGEPPAPGTAAARAGAALLAVVMLFTLSVFSQIMKMPADYGRDNYRHQLVSFLESKGLEYGYATFWQSQAVTVLSSSRVKCREVLATSQYGVYSDYYQSSRRWYTGNSYDSYFVLLTEKEYQTVRGTASWIAWTSSSLVAEYGEADGVYPGFLVFVFSGNVLDSK